MMESSLVLEGRPGWGVRRGCLGPVPSPQMLFLETGRGSRREAVSRLLWCRSQWEEQEQACSDLMLFDC